MNLILCTECDKEILPDFVARCNGICLDCRTCSTCGKVVTNTEFEFCRKHSLATVQHARCRQQTNPVCKIPVDALELHQLNLCRLLVFPDSDLSTESNIKRAELAQQQLWESLTIEQKFNHTKMMESVYSAAYMALKRDPAEKKAVQLEKANKLIADERKKNETSSEGFKRAVKVQASIMKEKLTPQRTFQLGMEKSGIKDIDTIKAIWVSQGKQWLEV